MTKYTQEQYEKDKADLARSRQDPNSFVYTPNIMIIRWEAYPTDQPLWHNGDGKTPRVEEPPRQAPDEGGRTTL